MTSVVVVSETLHFIPTLTPLKFWGFLLFLSLSIISSIHLLIHGAKKKKNCPNDFEKNVCFYVCFFFFFVRTYFILCNHLCYQGASRMRGRLGSMGSMGSFERVSFIEAGGTENPRDTLKGLWEFSLCTQCFIKFSCFSSLP